MSHMLVDIEQFTTADRILYAARSSRADGWMLQNYGRRTLALEIDEATDFVGMAESFGFVVRNAAC